MEKRIVKIPMPVELIRKVDEALAAGRGGLETREEFIREAAEGLLAEITYPDAPPEPSRVGPSAPISMENADITAAVVDELPVWEREELRLVDLAGTRIGALPPGIVFEAGVVDRDGEPMLGIHNRDYPSLWAADRLARYTEDGPVSFEDFGLRVTRAAWFYGQQLRGIEEEGVGARLTALFPTNPLKPSSAERAFQNFAVGSIPRRPLNDGAIKAGGPLFAWQLCQLQREDEHLLVALTPLGRRLLEDLAGLSLDLPHDSTAATRFLGHLVEHVPGDRWGFEQVLTAAADEPDREEVVSLIATARPDWTSATASSVAQGYVARAREWGLLVPRLHQGRYRLTELGEEWQLRLAE